MEISKELGYVKCVSYDLSFFHFQINVESSSIEIHYGRSKKKQERKRVSKTPSFMKQ